MTSSWSLNPPRTTMHGQPYIKINVNNFIKKIYFHANVVSFNSILISAGVRIFRVLRYVIYCRRSYAYIVDTRAP